MSLTTLQIQKPSSKKLATNNTDSVVVTAVPARNVRSVHEGITRIVPDIIPAIPEEYLNDENSIREQLNIGWKMLSETYTPQDDNAETTISDNEQLDALNHALSINIFETFAKVNRVLENPTPQTVKEYKETEASIRRNIQVRRTDPVFKNNGHLSGAIETAREILNPVIHHPELDAIVRSHTIELIEPKARERKAQEPVQKAAPNWEKMQVVEEIHIQGLPETAILNDIKESPIRMVRLTLQEEGQASQEKGLWGRFVSGMSKLIGRTQAEETQPASRTVEIYAKNDAIPGRYRNIINEYRKGNIKAAYSISRGIGREDSVTENVLNPERERHLLREGVNAGEPWAKEFLKIFHEQRAYDREHSPELRIQNALNDHKNGNLTRAYHNALKSEVSEQEKAYLNQPGDQFKKLRNQFAHLVVEAKQARKTEAQFQNNFS